MTRVNSPDAYIKALVKVCQPQIASGRLLRVKAGSGYAWGLLLFIDTGTYSTPLYMVEIMEGRHKGQRMATSSYIDQVTL